MKDNADLVFPLEEYERRLNELRERMNERRLDVVIITEPENLTYLTGHQTTGYSYFQGLIVPLDKEPYMVTRLLEESNVTERTWVEITRPYSDTGDAIQKLWTTLEEFGLIKGKNIGYEYNCYFFPRYQQKRFIAAMVNNRLSDCSGIVEEGRVVKSEHEIDLMRKAAHCADAGMRAGIECAAEGVTENDIAANVHYAMYSAGGEYPAVAPYITSGPRTNIGHATWEGRSVKNDEVVFLEIGGCLKRYHTAMMRTVHIGKPSRAVLDAEKIVLDAWDTLLDTIREGITSAELDHVSRTILNKDTSVGRCITRTGYSIGIAFAPSWDEGQILSIKPGENTPLKENMTFHIIPWLVGVDGEKVMAISETVRVTKDGCETFGNFERQLFVKE